MEEIELTVEEAKKGHKELWTWLAKNPKMNKEDWPGWSNYDDSVNSCFACALRGCNKTCSIIWPGGNSCHGKCNGESEIYGQWSMLGNAEEEDRDDEWKAERSRLATLIANLEWRV